MTHKVHTRVGILGGGQLAMYLCAQGRRLGMETVVVAHSADSPAAYTADRLVGGELADLALMAELVDEVDVITFDVEEVPPATLKYLASRAAAGDVEVHPAPAAMLVLQDKLLQKQWLVRNGLPTLPFSEYTADHSPHQARNWFSLPLVQKARRGGYDGRGVQVIRNEDELSSLWQVPSLIEPFVEGVRELAILAARSVNGEIVCFDPVELTFNGELNLLDRVIAPAAITRRQQCLAQAIAQRTLSRLEGAGVFALELFLTPDGDIVINEISPRVHNSGHHTLESCETSQFEQHLRAVCGLPLGSTLQVRYSEMRNLLGTGESVKSSIGDAVQFSNMHRDAFVHWYGKQKAEAGRKMGHVTALADTPESARQAADRALQEATQLLAGSL